MDEFLPDHLAVLLAALAASPHRLAYSRAEYLIGDEGQRPQRLRPFADIDYSRELLLVGSFIPASTWICERALFTEAGFFDESLERLDDWEWLLRASQLGAFLSVPAVTVLHQVGNDGGDQGREWFDRVYAKHPASAPELAAMRAQHLRQQFPAEHDAAPDDRAAALAEEFLSAARQGGLDVGALFEAAGSLTQGGRLDLAIGLYQGWLRHTESPLRYAVCYNLGTMFETDAQYGAAEQAYRDALGANPGFGPARMRLARQLERRADLSEAHAHWGWLAAPENGVAASDPQLHAEASGALRRFSAQIKKDIP